MVSILLEAGSSICAVTTDNFHLKSLRKERISTQNTVDLHLPYSYPSLTFVLHKLVQSQLAGPEWAGTTKSL